MTRHRRHRAQRFQAALAKARAQRARSNGRWPSWTWPVLKLAGVLTIALLASRASAETTRTRVDLVWRHIPRTTELARMAADLPNGSGVVVFSKDASTYTYTIGLPGGYACSTVAALRDVLVLSCATPAGTWSLLRNPSRPNADIDWIQSDEQRPAQGAKS